MAKAKGLTPEQQAAADGRELTDAEHERNAMRFFNDVTLLTLPTKFLAKLSDEAARRNMTVPELFRRALDDYLERTDPDRESPVRPITKED
jgi:hypothetical protein